MEFLETIGINLDKIIAALGTVLFAVWLVPQQGPFKLRNSPVRPNRFPVIVPFILFGVWLLGESLLFKLLDHFLVDSDPACSLFIRYLALNLERVIWCIVLLLLAGWGFIRGIRGLGLRWRTIPHDLGMAVVNLLAAYPLIFIGAAVVVFVGQQVTGPEFEFQENQALTDMQQTGQMPIYILINMVVLSVLVVPVFEELFFRGIFQSTVTFLTGRPWLSILITSIPFTILHPPMHIPALFVLSVCMGYAYEKSGSLLRPIFIHMLFNGITVASMLLSQSVS
ncbi:MAG: CPBP family intramembrane metalloprotease [Sedimentisphaerales bacterium]|nr:CPBP family intramembrane metalloprotease [Sedimentisphaerales bacterium]